MPSCAPGSFLRALLDPPSVSVGLSVGLSDGCETGGTPSPHRLWGEAHVAAPGPEPGLLQAASSADSHGPAGTARPGTRSLPVSAPQVDVLPGSDGVLGRVPSLSTFLFIFVTRSEVSGHLDCYLDAVELPGSKPAGPYCPKPSPFCALASW